MKKLKLASLILGLIISANSLAGLDCQRSLSNDFQHDSLSYQMNDLEFVEDFDENPRGYAKEAINRLYQEVGCEKAPFMNKRKSVSEVNCREIVPGRDNSKVCYVELDEGYFLLSKDYLDNVNVVWNRWD